MRTTPHDTCLDAAHADVEASVVTAPRMTHRATRVSADGGFSLLEIVIAMLIFAVIALAILPAAINASKLSTTNREGSSGNAFAAAQLASIRDAYPDNPSAAGNSCAGVRGKAGTSSDPAGTGLTSTVTVSTCPATYPGVVTVTSSVYDAKTSPTEPAVVMSTRVLVTAA